MLKLVDLALLLTEVYVLGQNIYFTTNIYPYWWRGIAADFSILSLTFGVLMLFVLPRSDKALAGRAGSLALKVRFGVVLGRG